ncbi:hypothetical protein V8C44DRAFT_338581 [Trichoderma aethiopicum]
MNIHLLLLELLGLASLATADTFFTLALHAPKNALLHGKLVNARDRSFIAGAPSPSTRCGLDDAAQCPAGNVTLVTRDMSFLAVSIPLITVGTCQKSLFEEREAQCTDLLRAYALSLRSPVVSSSTSPRTAPSAIPPLTRHSILPAPKSAASIHSSHHQAVLRASTGQFNGLGCLSVDGIVIQEAGSSFGAWEYT